MQCKWIALSVTTVDALIAGIDTRAIIVGQQTVARGLGADVEQIIWVSRAYLPASTVGLLLIGRDTDIIGRAKTYNLGFEDARSKMDWLGFVTFTGGKGA